MMKLCHMTAAALALAGLCQTQAGAQAIPYPNVGTTNPVVATLVGTGADVTAYFDSNGVAGFDEQIGMLVNGALTPAGYVFPTGGLPTPYKTLTAVGQSVDLGYVAPGDTITFALQVFDNYNLGNYPTGTATNAGGNLQFTGTPSYTLYSDPALNPDGGNHVYVAPFAANSAIPVSGTYVGFEDLLFDGASGQPSDKNYTDEQFVFTGLSTAAVPECPSFALLGLGLLPLGLIARRKLAQRAA